MANTISGSLNVVPGNELPEGNNKDVNPLDMANDRPANEDSDLIKTLVSGDQGDLNLLEVAPEVDRSLIEDISPPASIALVLLKVLFVLLAIASVSVLVLSHMLLANPNKLEFLNQKLDVSNMAIDLSAKNSEIVSLQTDVNFYRMLQAKAYLDKFSYYGDSFLQNYEVANGATSSDTEKSTANIELQTLRQPLKEAFLSAREKMVASSTATLAENGTDDSLTLMQQFKDVTIQKLQAEAAKFAGGEDTLSKTSFKNYTYAAALVGNTALAPVLRDLDFDKLTDDQLYWIVKGIDYMVVNDISTIQKLKDFKIKWTDIIKEIANRTMIADEYYTKDNYDQYGGIRYTSYSFDQDSGTVSIVGETKKFDTKTFTNITKLIDSINESALFGSAEMRSFSKSGDSQAGYVSSLKLSFKLKPMAVLQNVLPESLKNALPASMQGLSAQPAQQEAANAEVPAEDAGMAEMPIE